MSFQKLAKPLFPHTLRKVPYLPTTSAISLNSVLIYGRLSRDEDAQLNSMQNQMKIIRNYAGEQGLTVVDEIFDDDITGMHFERPGIHRICQLVENECINAILVKDLSRLGRHKAQTIVFLEYLRKYGVRVISVSENIDSMDEEDELMIGFKQILNDYYSKDISRKIRSGYHQKQKDGIIIVPPFGYFKDKNTHQLLIVPECAEIVRMIYRLYLEGLGYKRISQHLNAHGYKSPAYYQYKLLGKQPGGRKTSGLTLERDGIREVLFAAEEKRFDVLVTRDWCRITRNLSDAEYVRHLT